MGIHKCNTNGPLFTDALTEALLEGVVRLAVLCNDECSGVDDYRVVDMNKQAEVIAGVHRDQLIGKTTSEILTSLGEYSVELREEWARSHKTGKFEYFFKSTKRRFLISSLQLSEDEILVFFAETTYRRRAEATFRLHQTLFENAQDIILYVNQADQIVAANQKACTRYGYTKEQLLSMRLQDIRHSSTLPDYEYQMEQAKISGIVFESIHVRFDGTHFPVEISARSVQTDDGELRIHIIRDVTKRKEQEEKIAWLARHDGLTGILNRRSFLLELEKEIERAQRSESQFALILFDVDKFKEINDIFGHEAGDLVLKHIATAVKSILRSTDQVGRLGGDEFTVLAADVTSRGDMLALVKRIQDVVETPVYYKTEVLQVMISLGISLFPEDANESGELLHLADQAMYRAKHSGGGGFFFFSSAMISGKE